VLIFTVGPKKAPFNIHEALLQVKTAFFEVHTEQNGGTLKVQDGEAELDRTFKTETSPSTDDIMSEGTVGILTPGPSSTMNETVSQEPKEVKEILADYHLDTHFVKAFAIFVNWLYNTPPQVPATAQNCKTLIQAYLIALKYRATGLQNLALNRIRQFHINHQVDFDLFFIYLLNRHGDDVHCRLIKYFVDQIAYEIADSGVAEFDALNSGFEYFIRDRPEGKVRTALFHALGKIATAGKRGAKIRDPAVGDGDEYFVGPE
jgi:hypothetical protein